MAGGGIVVLAALLLEIVGALAASSGQRTSLQAHLALRGGSRAAIARGHTTGAKVQRWADAGMGMGGDGDPGLKPLRLRGGMILEPWECEAYASSTAYPPETFNITEDCLEDWDKEKEEAWTKMCEEELEDHWQQLREKRAQDIESGDVGCNYVADDEYMVRGVDGNIYKYRYDPKPYGSLGPNMEPRRLPLAVDKVNPDCLDDIVADLEARDQERLRTGRELAEEAERQVALAEALSWFNGTKRLEFENGKALWWRDLNESRVEAAKKPAESELSEETTSSDQYPDLLDEYHIPNLLHGPNVSSPSFYNEGKLPPPDFTHYKNDAHRSERLDNVTFAMSQGFVWNSLGEELRSCVWRGKAEFVAELLVLGADPNYRTVFGGWRPLHYAAWNDRPKIALQLIEAGAWKDVQNEDGQTPLHLAAARASTKCIPALLKAGCDANIRHGEGLLPLEVAHKMMICSEYSTSLKIKDAVLQLLDATSDQEARDAALEDANDHWTPMEGFAS